MDREKAIIIKLAIEEKLMELKVVMCNGLNPEDKLPIIKQKIQELSAYVEENIPTEKYDEPSSDTFDRFCEEYKITNKEVLSQILQNL